MATSARARRAAARQRERRSPDRAAAPPAPPPPTLDRTTLARGIAIVVTAGAIYWLGAARDIVVGDTAELAAAALTLGVAHPPGYPLLVVIGHLFSLFPLGPEAFRVNLVSVVAHAATVGLVYLTAHRLTGDRVASGLAALLLAFNPLFWSWSLVYEAFPLNNLIAAGMVYLLVVWHERPDRRASLVAAALLAGLGLTNHQTIVLLGPAVVFLLWVHRRALLGRPRVILACVGAFLVGLLPYAYVPFAAGTQPYWNWGGVATVADLIGLITRQNYGTGQLVTQGPFQGGSSVDRLGAFVLSFTVPEGALAILGWIAAYRVRRWYAWFTALALAFAGPLFALYANLNLTVPGVRFVLERFFLLAHVISAPLVALGVIYAIDLAVRLGAPRRVAPRAVAIAIVAFLSWLVVFSYTRLDQAANSVARRFGEDLLRSLPADGVLLVNGDEASFPVGYLQSVERQRPDVTMVVMPLLATDWYVRQLQQPRSRLEVPFARHDGRSATLKAFIDANPGRPFALVGPPTDDTIRQSYYVHGPGLVGEIRPQGTQVTLAQLVEDAERLYAQYRPPALAEIKTGTFERGIVSQYAGGALRVGSEIERAGFAADALIWYQRALAIDPELAPAREAASRVRR